MPVSPTEKCVIINADDFGFARGVSEGILRAHREGVVTSTTVAANMPAAEGCLPMLREAPGLGVGAHLNCTQGPPLSPQARAQLAGAGGAMDFTATAIILACVRRPRLVRAVEAEFDAQISWLLDRGITPTHLDTHRHSHAYYPIFKAVVRLAERYDIRFVRRHREVLPGQWPPVHGKQRRVAAILNVLGWVNAQASGQVFATGGTWGIAHTGVLDAAWLRQAAASLPAGTTEIMVHPGLPSADLDAGVTRLLASRQEELAALTDPSVAQAFDDNGVRRVHYGQL